jgi:hypothetical protein
MTRSYDDRFAVAASVPRLPICAHDADPLVVQCPSGTLNDHSIVHARTCTVHVVLGVLGLVGITIVGPSVPWVLRRALEATAIGATAFAVGRFDAFVVAARARIGQSRPPRILAPVVTAVTVLQVLLHGASGLPLAAAFLGVALVGFAIGARWHRPPEAAPGH